MVASAKQRDAYTGPFILSGGFRPFFFLAAVFAVLAVPVWLAAFTFGVSIGPDSDALGWHAHEMVYGYIGAVLAGFLMTAVPNWTGRQPIAGMPLLAFVLLWLLGRLAMGIGQPRAIVACIDVVFLVALAFFAWREIAMGKSWRNVPICLFLTLFAVGNILWHLETLIDLPPGIGLRLGIGIAVILMVFVGGRIIPSFTTNWLVKRQADRLPAQFAAYDKATLALTGLTVVVWLAMPDVQATGLAFIIAGVLHFIRLARWRGWLTCAEPLVAVLHVAYAWIPIGFLLMGGAILAPEWMATTTALHALTAGAVGLLTVAVMTRASLGHSGRNLRADFGTTIIYALIWLGAVLRVAAPFMDMDYGLAVSIAGGLWCAGFLLFVLLYGPMLFRPKSSP